MHVFLSESNGFVEPDQVSAQSFDLDTGEPFAAILPGLAKRLQVSSAHEHRKEVCRPAENLRSFFDPDACRPQWLGILDLCCVAHRIHSSARGSVGGAGE